MDAKFHAFSQAPAEATFRARFDSIRPSSIAQPQKAFAAAFVVFATALAGCASGLAAKAADASDTGYVARVEEGAVVAARPTMIEAADVAANVGALASFAPDAAMQAVGAQPGFAYTIRLPSGELVSVTQPGDLVMPAGTPVLVEYGASARVVPQDLAYGS